MHELFCLFELLFEVFLILVMLILIREKVCLNCLLFLILNFEFLYLIVKTILNIFLVFFIVYILLFTMFVSIFDVGSELHEHNFEPIIVLY